ncbi:hypothetical protein F5Y03DRAFT_359240 [Xylaria venustula]|nr:hypothetical protein F5Y03DRAFT_359240 [Xylaria venustula]
MSDHAAPSTTFGAIEAHNALAGNNFSGQTTITFHTPQGRKSYRARRHSIDVGKNKLNPIPLKFAIRSRFSAMKTVRSGRR